MHRLALYLCVSVQAHHHYINPFTCLLASSCVAATAFTRMLYPPPSAAFPTLLPLFTIFVHLLPSIYAQHALAPALLVVASPTAPAGGSQGTGQDRSRGHEVPISLTVRPAEPALA